MRCRAKEEPYIASMGIYVAKASAIRELLLTHFPEVRHPAHRQVVIAMCGWYNSATQSTAPASLRFELAV